MPASPQAFKTPLTDLFRIKHPIMLAGMNVAAGPKLAAAVTNAGGIGVIGGNGLSPHMLQSAIDDIKSYLDDKNAPFGVDLLIPQLGGNARKTNYDYNKGQLSDLTDIIIKNNAALFVCAVGVPPKEMVDRLHAARIPVMNMVGHPKHVKKALNQGVDIICAQGGEGGGHTGETPFTALIPACVDICKNVRSPLTGNPVIVVAAGGIYDGRGLAAAFSYGAAGVWVGTRFVASEEAGAPKIHKELIVSAGWDDTVKTLIYTGRPVQVRKTDYVADWEENRQADIKEMVSQGIIPHDAEVEKHPEKSMKGRGFLMGKIAGAVNDVKPAKEIIDEMVTTATRALQQTNSYIVPRAKL